MSHTPLGSKIKTQIYQVKDGVTRCRSDYLATEEPLEIRLAHSKRTIAITMRTPGADFELAAGFFYSEGIVNQRQDILSLRYCVDSPADGEQRYNIVNVALRPGIEPELQALERHFFTTSACGVCGKTSLESLKRRCQAIAAPGPIVSPDLIYRLPEQLRVAQGVFQATGGLHAAALFNTEGELLSLQEDVGRHNALDKLIGAALLGDYLPLEQHIVLVSGRASFEIMQKCLAAQVPILCAVSAPSSLAVSLAQEFNMTLVGFLRDRRFNVYAGQQRLRG